MSNRQVFKVVLCGEYGVGKSSIFRRFVHDNFVDVTDRASTLGFDHFEKSYIVDGAEVKLQLWDTGGLERVASVTTSYFKHSDAAILVFSYDAYESFNALSQHLLEVLASAENAKLFLCGNKFDVRNQGHGPSEGDVEDFYRENQITEGENLFKSQYSISCKLNQGVHDMLQEIATELARSARPNRPDPDQFKLKPNQSDPGKRPCCT